ncbi:MAG: ABC transporter ATP-binding protein [Bacteriovoracia bacterium]
MLSLEHITKQFRRHFYEKPFIALNDLSFNVVPGKITGFLGANGAGKTTSIKIIMDLIRADLGKVIFDQNLGNSRHAILSNVGYLPERPYFHPYLTGREFLQYMGSLQEMSNFRCNSAIAKWSKYLKIDFAIDRKINLYSKGMLQRLGIASSLLHSPKLLILDEPLSGLDPVGRKEIKDVIKKINSNGCTVFFSSHIVHDVEEICQDIIFIEKGKLVFQGPVNEILHINQNQNYEIELQDNDGTLSNFQLPADERDSFLKKSLSEGKSVTICRPVRQSLEEILYHIKE